MEIKNNSNTQNFTSLKAQKRLGEKVLREFNQEMGYLKSSTNLGARIDKINYHKRQTHLGEKVSADFKNELEYLKYLYKNDMINKDIKQGLNYAFKCKLKDKQLNLHEAIYNEDYRKLMTSKFDSVGEFKEALVKNVKQKGNKANCWEDMIIVYSKLIERGQKPHNFRVDVVSQEGYFANHFATVIGLKKGADITKPNTWGSKALIIDAWSKMVKPAAEGLEEIKQALLSGSKQKSVEYWSVPDHFIKTSL